MLSESSNDFGLAGAVGPQEKKNTEQAMAITYINIFIAYMLASIFLPRLSRSSPKDTLFQRGY
jgi:hypothetical protein